jgi:hypothetical protein
VHPKDCPDHKAAEADRKQHEAERKKREERQQALAHAAWFDWYGHRELGHVDRPDCAGVR